jgi:hypothetical protein
MKRLAPSIVAIVLSACGSAHTCRTHTHVDQRAIPVHHLPRADAPIDLAPLPAGLSRQTTIKLVDGASLRVDGDARLYRDGESVLVQRHPTSLDVVAVDLGSITGIERRDSRSVEVREESRVSGGTVVAVALSVVGGMILTGFAVSHAVDNVNAARPASSPRPW